jgi:two-component system chemotaxis response regulator CheV
MNMQLDDSSYLKSGSNELRVLEYQASGISFGINILKVSKIVKDLVNFTSVPETLPAVKGMFRDIDRLVPVVDLGEFLGIGGGDGHRDKVIVTEFFGLQTGFWVQQIDWIHRCEWKDIIDAEAVFSGIDQRYVIGIVRPTADHMVLLLDYETILLDLCPHLKQAEREQAQVEADLVGKRILVGEDSPAVRAMLQAELSEHGALIDVASDGRQAWDMYQQKVYDLVVCDVEMPQMDGLAVTSRIRRSERPDTPVIIYSSIGDMGMKARAKFLEANAHITKLDLPRLLRTSEQLIRGEQPDGDSEFEASPQGEAVAVTVPID